MSPTVAILGRPNVGKSTLFNVLTRGQGAKTGGQPAVTHPTAGTTRDVRRTPAELFGLNFTLLDTAGVEEGRVSQTSHDGHRSLGQYRQPIGNNAPLQTTLNKLAYGAADQADLLILVLDGASGVTPADRALAQKLRKLGKPLILVLNKGDLKTSGAHAQDAETLGFGAPILISAAHSQGFDDLYQAMKTHIPHTQEGQGEAGQGPSPEIAGESPLSVESSPTDDVEMIEEPDAPRRFPPPPSRPIRLAILGRPNVGKSTLVNALLEKDVMLTGPTAGLTREAIAHEFSYGDQTFTLIDTPGLRRKGKVDKESLEFLSVGQSLQAAEKADIIVLVLDASTHNVGAGKWEIFEQQDAQIAALSMHQYKPLVIALNKWDEVADKPACLSDVTIQLHHRLHAMHTPLAVPISAIRSKGLDKLLQAITQVQQVTWATFSTNKLNNLLSRTLAKRSPPLANGKVVSLKFIRQTDVNPPTFTFWGNRISEVSDSYKKFLRNQLADALGLQHLPVKVFFRANANPFANRAPKPSEKPSHKVAPRAKRRIPKVH